MANCGIGSASLGVIGAAIVNRENAIWGLDTFLMSCRALGRGAEDAFLAILATEAAHAGAVLRGEFIPTKKNDPARQFLRRLKLGPQCIENGPFQFQIEPNQLTVPPWITIDERSTVR